MYEIYSSFVPKLKPIALEDLSPQAGQEALQLLRGATAGRIQGVLEVEEPSGPAPHRETGV